MNIQGESDSDEETVVGQPTEPITGPEFGTNLADIANSVSAGKTGANFGSYSEHLVFESDDEDEDDADVRPKGRKRKRSSSGGEGELDLKSKL